MDIRERINESKGDGVWTGDLRREYGEEALDELLASGEYVKVKKLPKGGSERKWLIVKKGFETRLV